MKTVEKLKQKLLYKRIKTIESDKLILEDGSEVYFECTDSDCCAIAFGKWDTATLDAVITDVKLYKQRVVQEQEDGDELYGRQAQLVLYHNQNHIAQANLYADAGNGGYYYSVLSVFVNDKNIGEILSYSREIAE